MQPPSMSHPSGWVFVHPQQLQRLGGGSRAPSSQLGAEDHSCAPHGPGSFLG